MFLLYNEVNQPYIQIHPLPFWILSRSGHHSPLSRVPCTVCYTECCHELSISHMVSTVYMWVPVSPHFPPEYPYICSSHLCLYFCFANKIIYTIFIDSTYESKVKVKLLSRVRLFSTPWTVAYQAPPSMGFSRQEYWSGLPFSSPRDLPDPGIKPSSPALQTDTLPSEPLGKLWVNIQYLFFSFWRTSPCVTLSGSICISAGGPVSFLLWLSSIPLCVSTSSLSSPLLMDI